MGEKVRIITTHLPSGDEPKKEVHRTSILWRQVFYSLMTSLHVWLKGRTSVCAPWGCHCQANSRVTVPGVGKNRMQNQISCFPGTDNIYMVILHCRTSLLPGYVLAAGWPSAVPSEQRRRGLTCMMHLDRLYLACIFLFVPVWSDFSLPHFHLSTIAVVHVYCRAAQFLLWTPIVARRLILWTSRACGASLTPCLVSRASGMSISMQQGDLWRVNLLQWVWTKCEGLHQVSLARSVCTH